MKLAESHAHALSIEGAEPTGYGLGSSGWVNVPVDADGARDDSSASGSRRATDRRAEASRRRPRSRLGEDRVDLARARKRRLRSVSRRRERARRAARLERVLEARSSSSETRRHAVNASPAAVPSTASTLGGRPSDLLSVLEQHRALGAERHRDQPVPTRERLELVAVHDREVGIDGDRTRGRGIQAEDALACLPRTLDALVRISSWQSTASGRELDFAGAPGSPPVRRRSASRPPRPRVDERDARRLGDREVERDAGLAEPRERLVSEWIAPTAPIIVTSAPRRRRQPPGSRPYRPGSARTSRR